MSNEQSAHPSGNGRDRVPSPPFPGIATTADGAAAVAWVETHVCQGACAYPITSSTTMGTGFETAVADGKENVWGEPLAFVESESEHSAASTCEGNKAAVNRAKTRARL